jgi:hypothetical protein
LRGVDCSPIRCVFLMNRVGLNHQDRRVVSRIISIQYQNLQASDGSALHHRVNKGVAFAVGRHLSA